ncbi:hypothetical protein V8O11_23970 [Erwinia aphidicola]|uniref:Type VI secretion system protein ImpK n=1 Tax=Erwinia aphidicola TaxID=68334 RepID=A0ABU8DP77_ERWAP
MRFKKTEQRLIRAITLLDETEPGNERDNVMHLLHSARRACRNGNGADVGHYGYEARMMLRALICRRKASDATPEALDHLASATNLLQPDFETPVYSTYSTFMSASPAWRRVMLSIPFIMIALACWPLLATYS